MSTVVYKITFPNGKGYIGITNNFQKRKHTHIWHAKTKGGSVVHRAMRNVGIDECVFSILTECISLYEAKICEKALISAHNTFAGSGGGYNLTVGGEGTLGWVPSAKTRAKIGDAHRGKVMSAESRTKMSAARKGKPIPKDAKWRANISAALIGKQLEPTEARNRAIAARLGKAVARSSAPSRAGEKLSEKRAAKARVTRIGVKSSAETKERISAGLRSFYDSLPAEDRAEIKRRRSELMRERWFLRRGSSAIARGQTPIYGYLCEG